MRIATTGLLLEDDERGKPRVHLVDQRPVGGAGGGDQRLQHLWKREAGVEAVRSGFEIERRVERPEARENRIAADRRSPRAAGEFSARSAPPLPSHSAIDGTARRIRMISPTDMCTSVDAG